MPVLTSCEARSPPAVESPPRKKFKFSLKLKGKKKTKAKNPMDSDSENESGKENDDSAVNFERKEASNTPLTKSTNSVTDTSFGLQTVTPPLPYTGLANLGNTCYLNAVLQVLRYCPEFLKSLVNLNDMFAQNCTMMSADLTQVSQSDEDLSPSTKPSIMHSLYKLTNVMENAEENYNKFGLEANEVKIRSGWTTLAVRPQDFVKDFSGLCPLFTGYQQHDAQEFLRSFLSLVEEECVGLVQGEQQENIIKGNINITNNESKVRGGCKYPSTITKSVAMETIGEPTKMLVTDETTRTQPNKEVYLEEGTVNLQTFKPLQKSKVASPDNVNIVKQLFEGTLLLQTCCLNCEGLRQRYENFQDISVPVQNNKSREERGRNLSDSEDESDQDLNLSWAISKFASIERLNGENKYFCDNCATLTEADISTYFEKLPQVLTIHLKRFQTSYGNQSLYTSSWVTKVTKSLHTPQRLSLKKWCSKTCSEKNAIYSLFGVVMHSGMSSCSGHYLSYVNVDILKRQVDKRKMNSNDGCPSAGQCDKNGGCSTAVQCDNNGECSTAVQCDNNGECSTASQCEADGKDVMQEDDSCIMAVDQCYNVEVPKKTSGDPGDQSVKFDSCQSSATKASSLNSPTKDVDAMCHCKIDITKSANDRARNFCQKDINNVCNSTKCHLQSDMEDRNHPCKTNIEESGDLCCEETLAMDLDDEDTYDYLDVMKDAVEQNVSMVQNNMNDTKDTESRIKSNTQRHMRSRTNSINMTNDQDSESSSDEDETVIPRSMDITRYFKPIPKDSTKKSCKNIKISADQSCTLETSSVKSEESLNQNDETESCSQTTKNVLKTEGLVQESQSSAFRPFENCSASTNTRSDKETLNHENSNENHSCSQTINTCNNVQESKGGLQESPGQCSAFESYRSSANKVQNGHSIGEELAGKDRSSSTQRTEDEEREECMNTNHILESSLKLVLDMNDDDLCTNDETSSVDDCMRNRLNDNDNIDSLTDKCLSSDPNTNHVVNHHTHNTNHVEPSTTNGCKTVSDGKLFTCEDTCNDGSNSTWLKFDDAEVQEMSAEKMEEILSPSTSCYSTPYLLFYYRC